MTKTKNASLLLVFVLCGIAASHVAEAVFTAPLASPSRDEGEGWYFREFAVKVGSNPGPGYGPLLATDPEQLRSFYPGSVSLIGDLATINVVCPAGYHSSGCIGGTVPAGIGNLQLSGGLSTEFASGPGLLRDRPEVSEGFNKYTGCGATVRFNFPIPSDYLRQSDKVFVKIEAYCTKDKYAPPSNYTPPSYKPPSYKPPTQKPYDPCSCADAKRHDEHLGCASWTSSYALGATIGERICYVGQRCPGFRPSDIKYGSYWKIVPRSECY